MVFMTNGCEMVPLKFRIFCIFSFEPATLDFGDNFYYLEKSVQSGFSWIKLRKLIKVLESANGIY